MTGPAGRLGSTGRRLVEEYDAALVDLDGVVYVGSDAVPGAARSLGEARAAGMKLAFVTNNASRTPEEVAAHLTALGIQATPTEVATAAQASIRLLISRLEPGARVLVVGGAGLATAVADAGFVSVRSAEDHPVAVVQGYALTTTYADLAEAALAIRSGALWVAANSDATMPTPRGQVPGNGALVAALEVATGQRPIVAGKPELALHAEAVERTGATRALVVGDRLDTDIEGARRAGCDSLLVLSGVTDAAMVRAAPPHRRPTYVAADLAGLLRVHSATHDGGDGLDELRRDIERTWAVADGAR